MCKLFSTSLHRERRHVLYRREWRRFSLLQESQTASSVTSLPTCCRGVFIYVFAEEILSRTTSCKVSWIPQSNDKKNETKTGRYAIFDCRTRRAPITQQREPNKKRKKINKEDPEKEKSRVYINSTRNNVIVYNRQDNGQDTEKCRATMGVHGERVGKFMEHGGFSQTWRFIGLIVTRAKR